MKIELRGIHKHFGNVRANDGVDLTVESGTIHGVLGENGAGKSTLMKILSGCSRKTSGQILIDGNPVGDLTPAPARDLGIGMLHQDPLDFPFLSVLDNFMLGQKTGPLNGRTGFRKKIASIAGDFNFNLSPDAAVNSLTIGERQQLEILRLFASGVRTLILDEPTTGISSLQKEVLFDALRKLASDGKSVIIVSHKLEDVETLCDKITVLRCGRVAGEMDRPFDMAGLLNMMFDSVPAPPPKTACEFGEPVLAMKGVSARGGRTGLNGCDISVCQGEVVGLAGLEGSGQGVFLRTAAGLTPPVSGEVHLRGKKMNGRGYHCFKDCGVNFLPGSRLEEGLVPGMNIAEHFAILNGGNRIFIKWKEAFGAAADGIKRFRIKGRPEVAAESLSGGNQQRLLLSFISDDPSLLLLENPTRGLDVESANWVWRRLLKYRTVNTAIVFSSSELDEILSVSNRVLVFFDGRIIKDVKTDGIDVSELGRAIAGKV